MDVAAARETAVRDAVSKVRAIEAEMGVTRQALEKIREILIPLGERAELFPLETFGLAADEQSRVYCLSEDEDKRFALYASVGRPGKAVAPHNHTTWAVIVGVHGEEHNRFFEREDDGSVPGEGQLRQTGSHVVRRGSGVTLLPDDIHAIHIEGDGPTLHLHMYGLALDQLVERVQFNEETGAYGKMSLSTRIR